MQTITLKEDSIVLMCGAMGTGKSTLCNRLFSPHHIVSTDKTRQEFSGDFQDMRYNDEVFEIVYCTIEQRAKAGMFTVVDSTASNSLVQRVSEISKKYGRPVTVLKMPELTEDEVTESRMQHRWNYIEAYYRQVERIRNQQFPKRFNVIDIVDADLLQYRVENVFDVDLPTGTEYTIIPDVHGEYHLVLEVMEMDGFKNTKFIFLGDIIDRGASSYMTFRLVSDLVKKGKAYMVPGNHDNKLMRYFKKWLKDESPNKYKLPSSYDDIPTYGMKLAYGLSGTLMEFYQMKTKHMSKYAIDFVEFYNSLPPFLRLDMGKNVHYFAHAGVPRNAIESKPLTKGDLSGVLFRTMNLEDFLEMNPDIGDKMITVHLGHEVVDPENRLRCSEDHKIKVYKHDVGMGKEHVRTIADKIVSIRS